MDTCLARGEEYEEPLGETAKTTSTKENTYNNIGQINRKPNLKTKLHQTFKTHSRPPKNIRITPNEKCSPSGRFSGIF